MLQEVTGEQLKSEMQETKAPLIIYFKTPLCGTCAAAERMLSITLDAISWKHSALSCNVNFIPELAKSWEISSVPCLMIIQNGGIREKIYAFRSVDYLFRLLTPYKK